MHGVTAKVAQEVCVLFEHDDVDARARQQKAEHHSRWATASDTTLRRYFCRAIHRHKKPNGITMSASRNEALGDHE
jgi:hypothetical protein